MNVVFEELAKILNVGVDKAIELYPMIQKQFITYKILKSPSTLINMIYIGAILGIIVTVSWVLVEWISGYPDDNAIKFMTKVLIRILIVLSLTLIVDMILNGLTYYLSPDFMIIKEFILK